MNALRILGLIAALAFTVGFVGYLVTRPWPGIHFVTVQDSSR